MIETITTRHNHLIDPALSVWGWEIPVYLFLGGWVAGMMVLSGYFLLTGHESRRRCVCFALPLVGLVLLSLGMLALFLDLEHQLHVWRLYTTFEVASPMSWGAWILLLVYPALLANAALGAGPRLEGWSPALAALVRRRGVVRFVGSAQVGLGILLGVYTGVLLSSLGARPFWNSALLGPLFLLSGLSAGAAFGHLVAREVDEREALAKADNRFLAAEAAVLGLFLIGLLTATAPHIEAARLVLGGPYTAVFWVLVVGLGIALPLLVQGLAVSHRIPHTPAAPVLVLLGGLALRFVFVYAGQHSHWLGG